MRLKKLRESENMSQEELAKQLNLSQSSIAYYESDKKQPGQKTVIKIAKIFNVTIDYLYGVSDDPTPPQSKKKEPTPEEYVLSAKTLADATLRMSELLSANHINEQGFLQLAELAYKKFGLPPVKDTEEAAHLEHNIPATGVFEKVAEDRNEYKP